MSQYNTNMNDDSFMAFCAAWSCCFSQYPFIASIDLKMHSQAVGAGIVFG